MLAQQQTFEHINTVNNDDSINDNNIISDDELCETCYEHKFDIICPHCNYKWCKDCIIYDNTNFLQITDDDENGLPRCGACHKPLPLRELYLLLSDKDFKQITDKLFQQYLEFENQKLPEAMECCSLIRKLQQFQNMFPAAAIKVINNVIEKQINPILTFISERSFHKTMLDNLDDEQNSLTCLNMLLHTLRDTYDDEKKTFNITYKEEKLFRKLATRSSHLMMCVSQPNAKNSAPPDTWKYLDAIDERASQSKIQLIKAFNTEQNFIKYQDLEEFQATCKKLRIQPNTKPEDLPSLFWERKQNKNLGAAIKTAYLFRCGNPKCRGFVNSDYVCEICGTHHCRACWKPMKPENAHVCKREDVESIEEITKNSKPCPNCASRIFKISGCSQMFCTNCHSGFDWNTGKLIIGNFHNPHREAWLTQNRNIGVADDMVNPNLITEHQPRLRSFPEYVRRVREIDSLMRVSNEIHNHIDVNEFKLFKLRCDYILNNITEEEYKDKFRNIIRYNFENRMLTHIYEKEISAVRKGLFGMIERFENFHNELKQLNNKYYDYWMRLITEKPNLVSKIKNEVNSYRSKKYTVKQICDNWTVFCLNNNISKLLPNENDRTSSPTHIIKSIDRVFAVMPDIDDFVKQMDEASIETSTTLTNFEYLFGHDTRKPMVSDLAVLWAEKNTSINLIPFQPY